MQTLEHVSCPLCGMTNEYLLYVRDGFNAVRCKECDLTYINPRLTENALEAMYNENEISPQQYYERHISQDLKHFRKRLAIIERYKRGGSLLDIGTNIGTMLKVAKDSGWNVRGVEFNRAAAAFGSTYFDVPIEIRDFMKTSFPVESFDVVTMNDIIEHIPDPVAAMREVQRILKPDGVVFMKTPNIAAFMARLTKGKWLHLKPNEHLTYFSPATIEVLLDKTGFKLEHVQSIGVIRTLETMLQKFRSYSDIPYKVSRIIPGTVRDRVSFYINPGDEMAVVARKK